MQAAEASDEANRDFSPQLSGVPRYVRDLSQRRGLGVSPICGRGGEGRRGFPLHVLHHRDSQHTKNTAYETGSINKLLHITALPSNPLVRPAVTSGVAQERHPGFSSSSTASYYSEPHGAYTACDSHQDPQV